MITDADVKKLEKKFATKDESTKTQIPMSDLITECKNEILNEIRAIREDITIWKNTRRFRHLLHDA
jgi:hypothetical protein